MPFDLTAVSGINAASEGLGVVSNNLANAQTTAFKASRAEFADVFYGAQNSPGNGARVGSITQDFSNGTISSTGRDLDMAIDGEGFFILEDRTGKYGNVYTRNGSFKVDKDGFVASQDGNALQGYLLDTALSTEAIPVFDTTLSSINLDELNKVPKATDSMTFNINLDGQEPNNIDPAQTPSAGTINNSAGGNTALGGSTLPNIQKLTNPEADPFGGSPDFSTGKLVYDTLGGEHRLTTNFYKRDVVTVVNSDLTYDPVTQTYAQGAAGSGNAKYTSWIAQMTVEDYDLATGQWQTSGHKEAVPADGKASADAGMIFELRFDTNGSLI
ncbi:MAG: flagellar hook protein FlgE, partial [Piscirickettsiaceae bacterium CG12_big_fil_rev_8_21_14_0_65_44_934]